jgi:hypothetical protein
MSVSQCIVKAQLKKTAGLNQPPNRIALLLHQRLNRFRHVRLLPFRQCRSVGPHPPAETHQTVERALPPLLQLDHLHREAKRNHACVRALGVAAEFSGVADDPTAADDKGIYPPKAVAEENVSLGAT